MQRLPLGFALPARSLLPTLLALSLLVATSPAAAARRAGTDLAGHIDPFIGTGGHGHTYPGPSLPFGMVQLSPDTRLTGWDGCSGYHHSDTTVYGFSHTHLSGTGVGDYCDILLMPVTGPVPWRSGHPDLADGGYGSRFSKDQEQAAAGYYRTFLGDHGVEVELTATPRTGLHRYVFPAGRPARVVIDLDHRDQLLGRGPDGGGRPHRGGFSPQPRLGPGPDGAFPGGLLPPLHRAWSHGRTRGP